MSGEIAQWVTSILIGEKSMEAGVLGLLGSTDFKTRLSECKYNHWIKAFAKRPSLDEDLLSILEFKQSAELVSRSVGLVSDFVAQDAPLHKCAFALFTAVGSRTLVLEAIYIKAGFAFVAGDLNKRVVVPCLFAAAAEALITITQGANMVAFLSGLWTHFKAEVTQLNRDLVRLLLPLSGVSAIRKILRACGSCSLPSLVAADRLLPPSLREALNAATREKDGAMQALESLGTLNPILMSNLVRAALERHPTAARFILSCLEQKSCQVTLCAFRFACFVELFYGDATPDRVHGVIEWLAASDDVKGAMSFLLTQTKSNQKWRDSVRKSLRSASEDRMRALVEQVYESCGECEAFTFLNTCLATPLVTKEPSPKKPTLKRPAPVEPEPIGNKLTEYIKKLKQV